jgi:hypothetical protein
VLVAAGLQQVAREVLLVQALGDDDDGVGGLIVQLYADGIAAATGMPATAVLLAV